MTERDILEELRDMLRSARLEVSVGEMIDGLPPQKYVEMHEYLTDRISELMGKIRQLNESDG